ncbi:hypothetical protein BH24BAC1_BH24BAC1_36230 [soil metagenome]
MYMFLIYPITIRINIITKNNISSTTTFTYSSIYIFWRKNSIL